MTQAEQGCWQLIKQGQRPAACSRDPEIWYH